MSAATHPPKKPAGDVKAQAAALGASLVAATIAAQTAPAPSAPAAAPAPAAKRAPAPRGKAATPVGKKTQQPAAPASAPAAPGTTEKRTPRNPPNQLMAQGDPPKKVCYNVDPALSKHLLSFKFGLNMQGVNRKVNDTMVSLFALSQLPAGENGAGVTPELAEAYRQFVNERFPKEGAGEA